MKINFKIIASIIIIGIGIGFLSWLFSEKDNNKNGALYPIQVGEKYGYIDKNGKVILDPQFQDTRDFSEGLGAFKSNNKRGYVDSLGKIAIKPQFECEGDFSEGLALVLKGNKYGYIDKTGKFVLKPKFELSSFEKDGYEYYLSDIRTFSGGLAGASVNDLWGYIDKTGKFVIKPEFKEIYPFLNDLAIVGNQPNNEQESSCFAINKTGEIALDYNKQGYYNGVEDGCSGSLSDGMISVYSEKGNTYGYLDKFGNFIKTKVRFRNKDMWPVPNFSEGLAPYNDGYKVGFINKSGQLVIKPIFDNVSLFNEGLADFCIDDKCGYIDKTGKIAIKPMFDWTFPFKNGLAKAKQGNKDGYINKLGKFVWYQVIKEEKEAPPSYIKNVIVSTDTVKDINSNGISAYLKGFQKEIIVSWEPPEDAVKRETVIKIKINKDGTNASPNNSYEIIKSSGSIEFDDSATWKAISDPFEPLPDKFKGKDITILIDFTYIPRNTSKISDKLEKIAENQINDSDETDFGPYMTNLQNKIKSNWNPPKGDKSKRVIAVFKISKDGSLLKTTIKESSGDTETDDAAIAAVNLSAPFKPLPEAYKDNDVDVEFTFDYNVFDKTNKRVK